MMVERELAALSYALLDAAGAEADREAAVLMAYEAGRCAALDQLRSADSVSALELRTARAARQLLPDAEARDVLLVVWTSMGLSGTWRTGGFEWEESRATADVRFAERVRELAFASQGEVRLYPVRVPGPRVRGDDAAERRRVTAHLDCLLDGEFRPVVFMLPDRVERLREGTPVYGGAA